MTLTDTPNDCSYQHRRTGARRNGILTVLAAVCLIAVLAFVALAVDTGLIVLARTEMQKATDLAALASIPELYDSDGWPDVANVRNSAVQLVALNTANTVAPVELQIDDVVIGIYDEATKSVMPDVVEPDAIEVWAHRKQERGTGLALAFAPVIGLQYADISTSSVAYLSAATAADIMPMALRAPGFGPVDAEIAEVNPGKDGPSYPPNGERFEIGEQVTVFIYGKGKKSPVHLTLNIDSPGPGAPEANVKDAPRRSGSGAGVSRG